MSIETHTDLKDFVSDLQDVFNKHKKYLSSNKDGCFIMPLEAHIQLGFIEQTVVDYGPRLFMAMNVV